MVFCAIFSVIPLKGMLVLVNELLVLLSIAYYYLCFGNSIFMFMDVLQDYGCLFYLQHQITCPYSAFLVHLVGDYRMAGNGVCKITCYKSAFIYMYLRFNYCLLYTSPSPRD